MWDGGGQTHLGIVPAPPGCLGLVLPVRLAAGVGLVSEGATEEMLVGAAEQQMEKHGGLKQASTLWPGKLKAKSRASSVTAGQTAGTRGVNRGDRRDEQHQAPPASLPQNQSPRTSRHEASTGAASPWHGGAATYLTPHHNPSPAASAGPPRPAATYRGAGGSCRWLRPTQLWIAPSAFYRSSGLT